MLKRPAFTLNPQDVGQPRGIGISILFTNGNDVFYTTTTTKEQVKSNLVNYILTNKGEKFFNPTFGGDLRALIFDPTTTFDTIGSKLESEIYSYIPNIVIKNINVEPYPDENLVNIVIDYSINQQSDNLVINLSTNTLINQ